MFAYSILNLYEMLFREFINNVGLLKSGYQLQWIFQIYISCVSWCVLLWLGNHQYIQQYVRISSHAILPLTDE